MRPGLRAAFFCLVAALAGATLWGCRGASLPDNPTERHRAIMARAWGPESPETLERFLATREAILPVYTRYGDGLQQWALREASTMPVRGAAVFGVLAMRRQLDEAMKEHGLEFDDFQRLTILVYGRWLRAVREREIPEARVWRTLREMEVGVSRQLENNPPDDDVELEKLQTRLASLRHQADSLEPVAFMDKAAVLERIDPQTRQWLEQNRKRVEAVDFGFFDTAAPARTKEEKESELPSS